MIFLLEEVGTDKLGKIDLTTQKRVMVMDEPKKGGGDELQNLFFWGEGLKIKIKQLYLSLHS